MGYTSIRVLFVLSVIFLSESVLTNPDTDSRVHHRAKRYIEWGPDIAGPYCETRPRGCCPGRIDDCSVPILDTLCYCDAFCNRTRGDCCPDFFSFCLGVRPATPEPVRGKFSKLVLSIKCDLKWSHNKKKIYRICTVRYDNPIIMTTPLNETTSFSIQL